MEKFRILSFFLNIRILTHLAKLPIRKILVSGKDYLEKNKISVFEIDRGGDITYHGPGQIVGYPIINLEDWKKDTHKYLRALEEVIIMTCKNYGLNASEIQNIPEYGWVIKKLLQLVLK